MVEVEVLVVLAELSDCVLVDLLVALMPGALYAVVLVAVN